MTATAAYVCMSRDDLPIQALSRLAKDLLANLLPDSVVRLDLSGSTELDIRIVQLVEAARRHAEEVGSDFALTAPAEPGLAQLLARAGFPAALTEAVDPFWLQGNLSQ